MTTDTCAVCGAPRCTLPNVYCTKCNTTVYCSLKCERKSTKKAHKQTCGKPPPPVFIPAATTTTTTSPTPTPTARRPGNDNAGLLTQTITKPFTHIDQGTPTSTPAPRKTSTTSSLPPAPLRRGQEGEEERYSSSSSHDDALARGDDLRGLRHFLYLAAAPPRSGSFLGSSSSSSSSHVVSSVPGRSILPPWWTDEHRRACEQLAMGFGNDLGMSVALRDWLALRWRATVVTGEVVERYADARLPMQLRMLGEVVYGRSVGGAPGKRIMELNLMMEANEMVDVERKIEYLMMNRPRGQAL
ncbi:hypothetical protein C8A00DRAFT_33030 [Chaetomidium leptoderma]|uniref:MYND-type domain-containing protein n=1 Tax=Chaetomidium leptoderma TaxID=669021 RepID=A0AAN6VN33_9PEZI|nr:hypothetical protein C8A00DRAFT_33030 [Chaetomidium leptoderma]